MLLITSIIIIFIVLTALISRKLNVPLIIIALSIGIVFGSDVTGIIYFDDVLLTQQVANIALIFILFAGGYGTKSNNLKAVIRPTILLATIGVLFTAIITALIFNSLTDWSFSKALLLSTIVSSTDAAAVFSILKTRSISKNVKSITELESASNDPMAILATTFILQFMIGNSVNTSASILLFGWQLCGGVGIGIGIGFLGVFIFDKIKELDVGYFYLFIIGIVLFSFGFADLLKTSGMLSAFFAGLVMGNKKIPYKNGMTSFTEILSFIANVGMFILLGLLVFPQNFATIWPQGIMLFLIITFIGRPVTVLLCTIFTKLTFKEKTFLSWSGIRGAVPIVLATYPLAAGIDPQHEIFNIVFFSVTLSIIFQGTTIGKLADFLKLSYRSSKKPKQTMELVTIHDTNYELIQIFIDDTIYTGDCEVSDLALPLGTTITMINRDKNIIAPSGKTHILPGDTLSILLDRNKIEQVTISILDMFIKNNSAVNL